MDDEISPQARLEIRREQQRHDVRTETSAMAAAFSALQPLGEEARWRAMHWLTNALDIPRTRPGEPPF